MEEANEIVITENLVKDNDDCKRQDGSLGEEVTELSKYEEKDEDKKGDGYIEIICCELGISGNNLKEKILQWREARKHTVESLRELAQYLDNISNLANVIVAVRGNVLDHGTTVGRGIVTFAFGMSLPFLAAGAGIGLASLISRAVGVGAGLIGPCLGVVGAVLTLATAGRAFPVMVAGFGLWFASPIYRWVGAGFRFVARGIIMVGGAVMVLTAGTALTVCLGGAGLWLAMPAITRRVLGSRHVETVSRDIGEDVNITEELVRDLNRAIEEKVQDKDLSNTLEDIRDAISGKVVDLTDGSDLVWDITQLKHGIKNIVQDWKKGSTRIRVIADQLEEGIRKITEIS